MRSVAPKCIVNQSLIVPAARAFHFAAKPVEDFAVQSNRDLFLILRDRHNSPALSLAEIVLAFHWLFGIDCSLELLSFEWVAVLGLDGGGYFAAQADGVDGAALAKAF
jgi:hypothetical protein